ncbi:hypothetical protein GCM10009727_13140 [Actinomadura napierensis]|uniref:Uncharacterized protein n=1 Tax=Actinomadura napierensis TaxID=267854 RepID=A0ABN2YCF0_9ACTN
MSACVDPSAWSRFSCRTAPQHADPVRNRRADNEPTWTGGGSLWQVCWTITDSYDRTSRSRASALSVYPQAAAVISMDRMRGTPCRRASLNSGLPARAAGLGITIFAAT